MNIPNLLTLFRIALIPLFMWRFLSAETAMQFYAAAGILLLSGFTDTLDGIIARSFGMITKLGQFLDPLADKMTLAAVITALWIQRPELWVLYALLIGKELLMMVGGLLLHRRKVELEGSKWFGKLATVMFYVIMIVIVALPTLADGVIFGMLTLLVAFMLFSLLRYGILFRGMIKR